MTDMPTQMRLINRRTGLAAGLRVLVVAAMMMGGLTAGSPPALAQSLDAARASGMLGERFDGFAVARDNATPAVRQMVDSVNSQRRKIYAQRAAELKSSPAEVGKFYAGQIVAQAPSGTWFLQESGGWTRK